MTETLQWTYYGGIRCLTERSFVVVWQSSDSVADVQAKISRAAKEQGRFDSALKRQKSALSDATCRLEALKAGDVFSSALNDRDVCALKGEAYKPYSSYSPELIDLEKQIEGAQSSVEHRCEWIRETEQRIADPEGTADDYSGGYDNYVPSRRALQSRAKRYRDKGVPLVQLHATGDEPRNYWAELADLAEATAAKKVLTVSRRHGII
jgi:hypothetical protein